MKVLFEKAGFKDVYELEIAILLEGGKTETCWSTMIEVGALIAAVLSKADEAMGKKIKEEVSELVGEQYPESGVTIGPAPWELVPRNRKQIRLIFNCQLQ